MFCLWRIVFVDFLAIAQFLWGFMKLGVVLSFYLLRVTIPHKCCKWFYWRKRKRERKVKGRCVDSYPSRRTVVCVFGILVMQRAPMPCEWLYRTHNSLDNVNISLPT